MGHTARRLEGAQRREPTAEPGSAGREPTAVREARCGRVESNHHSLRRRVYSAGSSPVLSVRVIRVADRIRTDSAGLTTPGACRYTTATMCKRGRPESNRRPLA